MSIRAKKNKAVKQQKEVVDLLRAIFCPPLEDDDILSQNMGQSGTDVILTPAAKKLIPFDTECKWHSDKTWRGSCISSLEQTIKNTNKERIPLLVRRKNRAENRFILPVSFLRTKKDIMEEQIVSMGDVKSMLICYKDVMVATHNGIMYANIPQIKFIELIAWYKKLKH